jgi:hypothetical protein
MSDLDEANLLLEKIANTNKTKLGSTDVYGGGKNGAVTPERRMLGLAFGHVPARAIHVFASLRIADILEEGPKDAGEIAHSAGAHAPALYRLLRFLSTIDVVEEHADSRFSLTPLGRTLRSHPVSVVRDNALLMGSPIYWTTIGAGMLEQVRTGANAFRRIYGGSFFDYLAEHPDEAALFDAAMDSMSRIGTTAILVSYDFSVFRRIVDVAGGRGALLTSILKRNPSLHGILYDSESVITSSDVDAELGSRLEKIAGDFFNSVPASGDAYILHRILHDWDDESAKQILRRCREAIHPHGRLLIIELAAPEQKNTGNNWAAFDVLMMILFDGRERTLADFKELLRAADFSFVRVVKTKSPFIIIEAMPA